METHCQPCHFLRSWETCEVDTVLQKLILLMPTTKSTWLQKGRSGWHLALTENYCYRCYWDQIGTRILQGNYETAHQRPAWSSRLYGQHTGQKQQCTRASWESQKPCSDASTRTDYIATWRSASLFNQVLNTWDAPCQMIQGRCCIQDATANRCENTEIFYGLSTVLHKVLAAKSINLCISSSGRTNNGIGGKRNRKLLKG